MYSPIGRAIKHVEAMEKKYGKKYTEALEAGDYDAIDKMEEENEKDSM